MDGRGNRRTLGCDRKGLKSLLLACNIFGVAVPHSLMAEKPGANVDFGLYAERCSNSDRVVDVRRDLGASCGRRGRC